MRNQYSKDDIDRSAAGNSSANWRLVGRVRDSMSAEYAKETLASYDIPGVIISESGFFGKVGLNLPSLWGKEKGYFKILVPMEKYEEAVDILDSLFGDSWEKNEEI